MMNAKRDRKSTVLLLVAVLLIATASGADQSTQMERVQPSPECLKTLDGERLYEARCASCHGATGLGNGPAAGLLKWPPADLTRLATDNDGMFPSPRVRKAISGERSDAPEGSAMPRWERIPGCEISDLVAMRLRVYNLTQHLEEIQALSGYGLAPAIADFPAAEGTRVIRVGPWHLLQSSGDELYGHMCASCHGGQRVSGLATRSPEAVQAPPLTHLRHQGIPREHWVYVLESPCDDVHHGAQGTQDMPCWSRIFRHALGNDAASLLVSTKLASYLDTIQVERP